MDFLTAPVERVAEYGEFLTEFARNPSAAVLPITPNKADGRPQISSKLLLFAMFGVGVAYLALVVGHAIGMPPDKSSVTGVFSRIGEKAMPLVTAAAIFLLSLIWHVLVWIMAFFAKRAVPDLAFHGEASASINAGLALGAFYIPIWTILIVVIRLTVTTVPAPNLQVIVFIVVILLLWVAFFVHAGETFAATHKLPVDRAFFLCFLAMIPVGFLLRRFQ